MGRRKDKNKDKVDLIGGLTEAIKAVEAAHMQAMKVKRENDDKIIAETLQKRALKLKEMEKKPEVFTKLVDKHHSPMIIRKYTKLGFPFYVGIISDNNLSDFDEFIIKYIKENPWVENIQGMRDWAGDLTEKLTVHYDKTEGVAVLVYADKMFISSLFGDFMTHAPCKAEFFAMLNMSTGV